MNGGSHPRELFAAGFDPSSGRWIAMDRTQPAAVERLTLVTYNIWFGEHRWRERLRHLLDLVARCEPDIVALQEVTPGQLAHVLAADWIRRDFLVSDISGATLRPHGVLLLSRLPMRDVVLCSLPSRKDRKLLIASIDTGNERISVGNLHLESSPSNQLLRLAQLKRALSTQSSAEHALLMGDFNFDPRSGVEQSRLGRDYIDLWSALSSGRAAGHTVDSTRNRMRFLYKRKHKHVRFDRILLRSAAPGWVPRSIRLLGTEPISPAMPETYPSDHFGLTATIERQSETTESARNQRKASVRSDLPTFAQAAGKPQHHG
jgi:tyrosyl-DNA phosphodiesterase 2